MIRVVVIAAAPAVRAGLRVLLTADAAIEVLGEAAALDDLPPSVLAACDVLVVHGLPRLPRLPETLHGVLLVIDEDELPQAPPALGTAWALLPDDAGAEELVAAVGALDRGLLVIHPLLQAHVLRPPAQRSDPLEPLAEPLTPRELDVLQLLGQGYSNKMIARQLGISEHTVKFHVSAIYAKLGVASRTEAVRAGARRGLLVL